MRIPISLHASSPKPTALLAMRIALCLSPTALYAHEASWNASAMSVYRPSSRYKRTSLSARPGVPRLWADQSCRARVYSRIRPTERSEALRSASGSPHAEQEQLKPHVWRIFRRSS